MGADSGGKDFVRYGTALEREEDLSRRKRKLAVDKGQARRVAPWQQEVTDSEGRRRFHGAFTGGFSAGYFNTAGSKEGWEPATFTSSRKKRADVKEQSAYDYMDEDEKTELKEKEFGASSDFDTFGSTAAEVARREAAKEVAERPSIIPGPIPDEIVVPAVQSIGVKLLLKMGWRHGRSIGPSHIAAAEGSRRKARRAMIALANDDQLVKEKKVYGAELPPVSQPGPGSDTEAADARKEDIVVPKCTPVFVLHPKTNKHGLGYDPFQNAPEFRGAKHAQMELKEEKRSTSWRQAALSSGKPSLFRPNAGRMSAGFGIGALEDLGEEDEDVYAVGFDYEIEPMEADIKPALKETHQNKKTAHTANDGILPGFNLATVTVFQVQWFPPPKVPSGFVNVHKFAAPLHVERVLSMPEPAAVPPPEDKDQCKMIEGLAAFVARIGQKFEDLTRERNMGNSLFGFLFGGPGNDYYVRRLWEERCKIAESGKEQNEEAAKYSAPSRLDAEQRGKILKEVALPTKHVPVTSMIAPEDRARLQSVLMSTFTKSGSEGGDVKPAMQAFRDDPAKQARYKQYMKDKTLGGLRSMDEEGRRMTEVQRAQEILEFENAARGLQQPAISIKMAPHLGGIQADALMGTRFTTSALDGGGLMPEDGVGLNLARYPRREEQPWRPNSLLCKRFDVADPYAGKPLPIPKPRSRTESLILVSSRSEILNPSQTTAGGSALSNVPSDVRVPSDQFEPSSLESMAAGKMEEQAVETITVKPVDLFKAIFSDSEESENDEEKIPESLSPQIKRSQEVECSTAAEAAHSALNRLVAGDFLESLGKELGLKVPSPVERRTNADRASIGANIRSSSKSGKGCETETTASRETAQRTQPRKDREGETERSSSRIESVSDRDIRDRRRELSPNYSDSKYIEDKRTDFDVLKDRDKQSWRTKQDSADLNRRHESKPGRGRRSRDDTASKQRSVDEDSSTSGSEEDTLRKSRERKTRAKDKLVADWASSDDEESLRKKSRKHKIGKSVDRMNRRHDGDEDRGRLSGDSKRRAEKYEGRHRHTKDRSHKRR